MRIANRRSGDEGEVETLQMIQAKNNDKDKPEPQQDTFPSDDKTIYKVYPVNTPPIKMDVIENPKKETVVIGTRAELPLPPSKIQGEFDLFDKDRNDSPILKPHTKPVKSDFPYPLERPSNGLEDTAQLSNNQWNTVESLESRIVNLKAQNPDQISATLKTFTERPIAVAYTPTEPDHNFDRYRNYFYR